MPETLDCWLGTCSGCGREFEITTAALHDTYPQHADIFSHGIVESACPCGTPVVLNRTLVKTFGPADWTILPPASGCPDCGKDHDPDEPHDAMSLLYQYTFRSREARAGREERWPTWADAMAHCMPQMKAAWTRALAEKGVIV